MTLDETLLADITEEKIRSISKRNIIEQEEVLLPERKLKTKKVYDIYKKVERKIYFVVKRVFDVICSLIGIMLLIPISIVVKISYLITGDTESIFYKQKRIGKNGRLFDFYKIRTMIPNADEKLDIILENDEELAEEYSKNKKLKNDPRITKVGKFLRKTSLDEFPQFINVIKGDMSVIGNRPYLPREKQDMKEYYDSIVKTKCGIVSYWAVMGRSDISFKNRCEIEKFYSYNYGFRLDAKIFFKVIKVVLCRRGAV